MEVEVAAYSVHAKIFTETGRSGDTRLRQSYHELITQAIPTPPQAIVDIGCSVGMSTFALQKAYPHAHLTGVDLSPILSLSGKLSRRAKPRSKYRLGSRHR